MESVMGQAIVLTVVGDTEAIIDIVHFLLPTSHSIDCNYLRQYLYLSLRIISHVIASLCWLQKSAVIYS